MNPKALIKSLYSNELVIFLFSLKHHYKKFHQFTIYITQNLNFQIFHYLSLIVQTVRQSTFILQKLTNLEHI